MLKANDYRQYTMFHLRKLKADGMDKNCRRWRLILCAQKSINIFLLKFLLRNGRTWVHFAAQNGKTLFFCRIHVKCAPCHIAVQWLGPWFCSNVQPFRSKIKWFVQVHPCNWTLTIYNPYAIYYAYTADFRITTRKVRSSIVVSQSITTLCSMERVCLTCAGAGWDCIIQGGAAAGRWEVQR